MSLKYFWRRQEYFINHVVCQIILTKFLPTLFYTKHSCFHNLQDLISHHMYINQVALNGVNQRNWLTHWGRGTYICVSKLTIIGSDDVLSPGRRQAIIWTNAGIWLIPTLGTNFSEILGKIHIFSVKKMYFKMSSAKGRLFSFGLNELNRL